MATGSDIFTGAQYNKSLTQGWCKKYGPVLFGAVLYLSPY